ncbi:hypothetical protein BDM02DRAFT_3122220 [Thelephora ganbajun]|uniref:Uncharacterized protein n=1 Tax=Thelephora ganbajun TaxID=370292 RepID=A0ACB6Z3Z1_THEGA|nr:hypothetical protein BDM02DRAFT_3122220 [Thelephora ganbajun]
MGKKNKGSIPCALCDYTFASIANMQQHRRDKHPNTLTQAPAAQAQPPAQPPQVQVKNDPVPTPAPSLSSKAPEQDKIASHGWRCVKCPKLPPFENGTAWQIVRIPETHRFLIQSQIL